MQTSRSHGGRGISQREKSFMLESLEFCSKTEALSLVENLGFKNPSTKYLHWYFKCNKDGLYYPLVEFKSLKKALEEKNLIKRMAEVANLPKENPKRKKIVAEIGRNIIKNRRRNSAY
jgi:hypothetical protein